MKKILAMLAAAAAVSPAFAGTLFTMDNDSGGKIELQDNTQNREVVCNPGNRLARAWNGSGQDSVGCWVYDRDVKAVRIHWVIGSGRISTYSEFRFQITDYGRTQMRD